MLRSKAKYSSRTRSVMALIVTVAMLLSITAGAIYTAIAAPTGQWKISQAPKKSISPSAPEPVQFRFRDDVDPEAAVIINAAVPDAGDPIVPAPPLSILSPSISSRTKMLAVECLSTAIYYEAASESIAGQRAVAQVILNRVRHPEYPNSVCSVVFQGSERTTGCQFSFTCDGSLARRPSQIGWARAQAVAARALAGYVETNVGLATHYHTIWVVPYWSSSLSKLGTIGSHIFYKWSGRSGTLSAFRNRYSGMELMPQTFRSTASPVTTLEVEESEEQYVAAASIDIDQQHIAVVDGARHDTGLLVIPQMPIKSDSQNIYDKIEGVNGGGLIIDKAQTGIRSEGRSLLVDRRQY